ncbi:MAG TPA: PAS domain-containing protein [Actinomycetota bacterium]|nr:PAS domain-containing protein [Actinomycetota bacterium]
MSTPGDLPEDVEAFLRRADGALAELVESAQIGIAYLTLECRFSRANDRFCQLTGFDEAELMGSELSALLPPEDAGACSDLHQLVGGSISDYSTAYRFVRKDRSILELQASAKLVRGTTQAPAFVVLVVEASPTP